MAEELSDSLKTSIEKHTDIEISDSLRLYGILCDLFAQHAMAQDDFAILKLRGRQGVYSIWEQFGKSDFTGIKTGSHRLEQMSGIEPISDNISDGKFVMSAVRAALASNPNQVAPFHFEVKIVKSPNDQIADGAVIILGAAEYTQGTELQDMQLDMHLVEGQEVKQLPAKFFGEVLQDLIS